MNSTSYWTKNRIYVRQSIRIKLLSSSPLGTEDHFGVNINGKNLLHFAELCYNSLLKRYAKTIA